MSRTRRRRLDSKRSRAYLDRFERPPLDLTNIPLRECHETNLELCLDVERLVRQDLRGVGR